MTSKNYLCLEVTAAVTLASNDGQVVADFTSALIEAIEVGRLQESREVVHPDSQIIVYKGEFIETPSPSQTSSPATISPLPVYFGVKVVFQFKHSPSDVTGKIYPPDSWFLI